MKIASIVVGEEYAMGTPEHQNVYRRPTRRVRVEAVRVERRPSGVGLKRVLDGVVVTFLDGAPATSVVSSRNILRPWADEAERHRLAAERREAREAAGREARERRAALVARIEAAGRLEEFAAHEYDLERLRSGERETVEVDIETLAALLGIEVGS